MAIDLSQFFQVFFEESDEHLASMESLLLELDLEQPDDEQLAAIFRAAHSIKGNAGTFGFDDLAETTHVLENLLDRVRKHELAPTRAMVDACLAACDVLRAMLAVHRGQQAESDLQAAVAIRQRLAGLTEQAAAGAPALTVDDESYGFFDDFEASTVKAEHPPADDDGFGFFEPLPEVPPAPVATEEAAAAGEENDGYGFFTPLPEGRPAAAETPRPAAKSAPKEETSIRVGVDKVDQLINLVGELVITQSMLLQAAAGLPEGMPEDLASGLAQLERNSRELQEAAMSIRMLPISHVFSRFPRVVRDLAGKLGKEVELRIAGEGTELDKGLVERLVDPLTHLIRNSLDHGIETPAGREAAGKPSVGVLTLSACHRGGHVVIEVGDDGAGIDRQRVLAKALERGLPVSPEASDQEVFALIFEAGFSTAETVTDLSGRGVGMDVVRRNIEALGGKIEIDSLAGAGTRITIRLPLTLAIMDGMSVAVSGQTYIVPLISIVESLQPAPADLKTLAGQGRVLAFRGEYLPVLALHEVFFLPPPADPAAGIVVVLEADGRRAAVVVDALVGQQQVVVKSLEANYRRVPGVSGATILGNGRVALILDPGALVAMGAQLLPAAA